MYTEQGSTKATHTRVLWNWSDCWQFVTRVKAVGIAAWVLFSLLFCWVYLCCCCFFLPGRVVYRLCGPPTKLIRVSVEEFAQSQDRFVRVFVSGVRVLLSSVLCLFTKCDFRHTYIQNRQQEKAPKNNNNESINKNLGIHWGNHWGVCVYWVILLL